MSITRVWIAGAGGRLGSALYHRFSGNTDYKLVTSDRDVPIEDAREAGRFADLNHPDVIINCPRCNGFVDGPNSAGSFYIFYYQTLL